jgi:hypothetical protein
MEVFTHMRILTAGQVARGLGRTRETVRLRIKRGYIVPFDTL